MVSSVFLIAMLRRYIHRPIRTSVRILIWQDYTIQIDQWDVPTSGTYLMLLSIFNMMNWERCSYRSVFNTSREMFLRLCNINRCPMTLTPTIRSVFAPTPADRTSGQQDLNITCITVVIIPTTCNRNITMKQQQNDFNRYCLLITLHSPNLSVSTL